MAYPCRVVDVIGAEESYGLLRDVVRLVCQAASRQIKRQTFRIGEPDARSNSFQRFVPRDTAKAILSARTTSG